MILIENRLCLQFLNSPNLSFDATLASTPVNQQVTVKHGSPGLLVTPNPLPLQHSKYQADDLSQTPPRVRRSVNTPRTPTPLKNALAEIEKSKQYPYTVSNLLLLLLQTLTIVKIKGFRNVNFLFKIKISFSGKKSLMMSLNTWGKESKRPS